jgi:N-acetylmuramoyl-L-alanine amidase
MSSSKRSRLDATLRPVLPVPLLADVVPSPAPLVCIDPGHARTPNFSTEPIGPGSSIRKIKDGGGTAGEAVVVLQIARKVRYLLDRRGLRVAMTRTGAEFTYGAGGNVDRARFCNRRDAALMVRIHADGSLNRARHGVSTLYPAWHRSWTDDIYAPSLKAARIVQSALVRATGATNLGLSRRSDLTGFNWANVPVVLAEAGFLTNPTERARLTSARYQWKVAGALTRASASFVSD